MPLNMFAHAPEEIVKRVSEMEKEERRKKKEDKMHIALKLHGQNIVVYTMSVQTL